MLPPTNSNPLRNRRLAVDSTSRSIANITFSSVPVADAGNSKSPITPTWVSVALTISPPSNRNIPVLSLNWNAPPNGVNTPCKFSVPPARLNIPSSLNVPPRSSVPSSRSKSPNGFPHEPVSVNVELTSSTRASPPTWLFSSSKISVPPFIARTVPVLVRFVLTLLLIVFPDIAASINPWLVTELKNPNVPPCVLSAPPIVTPEPIVRFVVVNCANRLLLVVPLNVTEPVPSTV